MDLLADLLSGDPTRIWSASCAIRTLRDRAELQRLSDHADSIERATRDVPLGGMVRSNSTHLQFALSKLAFVAASSECLCTLYEKDDLFDPYKEEEAGNVRIVSKDLYDCVCVCNLCGAQYQVEEQEYHYLWWRWKRA